MKIDPLKGEIWCANLSPTIGHEQAGRRPVLIISENIFNRSKADLCMVLPLTSTIRNIPAHFPIKPPEGGLKIPSAIMCENIRGISKKRLIKRWGKVTRITLVKVRDILRILLGL